MKTAFILPPSSLILLLPCMNNGKKSYEGIRPCKALRRNVLSAPRSDPDYSDYSLHSPATPNRHPDPRSPSPRAALA